MVQRFLCRLSCLSILLAIHTGELHAQVGATAVPWAAMNTSTQSAGMGRAHSMFGPDILGQIQFYPNAVSRIQPGATLLSTHRNLTPVNTDMEIKTLNMGVAHAFQQPLVILDRRWTQAISLNQIVLYHVPQTYTNEAGDERGEINPRERLTSLCYGLSSTAGKGSLELGLSVDHIRSDLASGIAVGNQLAEVGKATAFNLGVGYRSQEIDVKAGPIFHRLSVHYGIQASMNRIGQSINYVDARQADPLPRAANLGLNVELAALSNNEQPILKLRFVLEQAVSLVRAGVYTIAVNGIPDSDPLGWNNLNYAERQRDDADDLDIHGVHRSYRFFPGPLLGDSELVERKIGVALDLMELIRIRVGKYSHRLGHRNHRTIGFSVGLDKIFNLLRGKDLHVQSKTELILSSARYYDDDLGPLEGTEFASIELRINPAN